MSAAFTMYTTSWCGFCMRLKQGLTKAGITWDEIDIERDESAADRVMQVNGGNQTVPTLEFSDGSALTNPSVADVQQKLAYLSA
jgi:mycoredoxin